MMRGVAGPGRILRIILAAACLSGLVGIATLAQAEVHMIEDFTGTPAARWDFISDQVMGGVSQGQVVLGADARGGPTVLHLQGSVSTQNNGGFIQARLKLPDRLPPTARGLELRVKGNGQIYYIHARTRGTLLPWNFYQASFPTGSDWAVVRIPFADFSAQGRLLRKSLLAEAIVSIAVVAYGRDHIADVSVARIGYY